MEGPDELKSSELTRNWNFLVKHKVGSISQALTVVKVNPHNRLLLVETVSDYEVLPLLQSFLGTFLRKILSKGSCRDMDSDAWIRRKSWVSNSLVINSSISGFPKVNLLNIKYNMKAGVIKANVRSYILRTKQGELKNSMKKSFPVLHQLVKL